MRRLIALSLLGLLAACAVSWRAPVSAQATMFRSFNYPSGLVGWWKLCGDTSASSGCAASGATAVYDSSGYGNNGAWAGAASGTNGYYSAGKVGPWAGTFNGSTDYVNLGQPPVLALTAALTITAWENMPSNAGQGVIVGLTGFHSTFSSFGSNGAVAAYWTTSGTPGGYQYSVVPANAVVGGWNFVAMTYDSASGNLNLYCNGVLAGSYSYGGTIAVPGSNAITIGARSGGTSLFATGQIDDVRIYNRALSAREIAQMYLAHN